MRRKGYGLSELLFVEDLFDISDFFLSLAFGLVRLAFRLKPFVSNGLAGDFLGFASKVFAGAFCFVLIA